jgi:hypothetical protein
MAWSQPNAAGGKKGGGKGIPPPPQVAGRPGLPRPATVPANGPGAASGSVIVSGCQNLTVSNIIKGTYTPAGANHGKPVFKKDAAGGVSVLIYFWDDRDGPNFGGWWFGPKVGGDQVWAYNGNKASQILHFQTGRFLGMATSTRR